MKIKFIPHLIIFSMALIFLSFYTAHAELTNPSFEELGTGWNTYTTGGYVSYPAGGQDGSNYTFVRAYNGDRTYIYQSIDWGAYDEISFYYKTSGGGCKVEKGTLLNNPDRWDLPAGVSTWTNYDLDISSISGVDVLGFRAYAGGSWETVQIDNVRLDGVGWSPNTNIEWVPDPGDSTNNSVWRDADFYINYTHWNGLTTGLLRSRFYTYQWINNTWSTRSLRTWMNTEVWPRTMEDGITIYLIDEEDREDTLDWSSKFPPLYYDKVKLEVTIEYLNGTEITNDVYIFDPEYVYTPPIPEVPTAIPTAEPTPTPTYTPFPTLTPTPIPTPDPNDEGITNYTINKTGMDIFYDGVNGTIENLNGSINGVTDFFLIPTNGMTNYVNSVNSSFTNNTNQSIEHKTILSEIMIPFIYHFPLKMQLLISYYLTLLLILIILER